MRRLAERCGETVLFGVADEDGQSLTYVDVIESRATVRFIVPVGDRRPLYCTAGGRMLLAAGNESDAARYLQSLRPAAITAETETDSRRLAEAVAAARVAGFAQTIDQVSDGVTGTAAPVRDAAGTVIGALIVAAPSLRLQHRLAELARLVVEEAAAISRSLGYR
jgi:DNA-binding IclR family transcriptional regulator